MTQKFYLDQEISQSPWMLEKIRTREDYAQNLYAAFCNMRWCKREMWTVLSEDYWSASWRSAGGLVADWRNQGGDYMDYYCSGIKGGLSIDGKEDDEYFAKNGYVSEGEVTDEIADDLYKLGWVPVPYSDSELRGK